MIRQGVGISTSFIGFHRWPDAPDFFRHLRFAHRHVFGVKVWVLTNHNDRDVEFQDLKNRVNRICSNNFEMSVVPPLDESVMTKSCEQIAQEIGDRLILIGYHVIFVEVDEDGENLGWVQYVQD